MTSYLQFYIAFVKAIVMCVFGLKLTTRRIRYRVLAVLHIFIGGGTTEEPIWQRSSFVQVIVYWINFVCVHVFRSFYVSISELYFGIRIYFSHKSTRIPGKQS